MGDVIGVLLGSMRQDQIDAVEGMLELLDCSELHLLEGNPIDAGEGMQVVRYNYPTNRESRQPTTSAPPIPMGALRSLVVAHSSPLSAYLAMIRKCNVLIGTPAGVEAARAVKPIATFWTIPA